jgi:hypothetical protein
VGALPTGGKVGCPVGDGDLAEVSAVLLFLDLPAQFGVEAAVSGLQDNPPVGSFGVVDDAVLSATGGVVLFEGLCLFGRMDRRLPLGVADAGRAPPHGRARDVLDHREVSGDGLIARGLEQVGALCACEQGDLVELAGGVASRRELFKH